ncbi:hypothetical protein GTP45_04385 [Pseudoduganella sp. FT55W]|uniref:PEP-CTERM sorting domain-containing protein n=1 Tax=Duganella rivi TaxID=2666083 RepID=A0A7X4GP56_9BURK|nr:hypothetical protein [Duganella rivi]MYM66077.1 hypothetical protein [Duganella rivi]
MRMNYCIAAVVLGAISLSASAATVGGTASLSLTAGAWYEVGNEYYVDQLPHTLDIAYSGDKDSGGGLVAPYTIHSVASGSVTGGVLKAAASTSYTQGPLGSSAGAFGQWSDSLTVNVPGLEVGTPVKIHYTIQVSGTLAVDYSMANGPGNATHSMAYASWNFDHYIGNTQFRLNAGQRVDILNNGASLVTNNANWADEDPYGLYTFDGWVPANMELYTHSQLIVQTWVGDGRTVSTGSASADLGHSIYWGGIDAVSLADGSAVDFTISSASGLDYGHSFIPSSVPEPLPGVMFLLGVPLLMAMRKRRM